MFLKLLKMVMDAFQDYHYFKCLLIDVFSVWFKLLNIVPRLLFRSSTNTQTDRAQWAASVGSAGFRNGVVLSILIILWIHIYDWTECSWQCLKNLEDVWMHVRSWSGMVWLEPETDRKGSSKSRQGFIALHGWLMKSRCDSFGTLRPQGRAGHKDRVAQLERAPPAAPEFWQRQGLRTGPQCESRFSGFWVPNVLVIILKWKSQPWTPWGPMSSSPPSSRNPGIHTPRTSRFSWWSWVVQCTTQTRTMRRGIRRLGVLRAQISDSWAMLAL